MANLDDARRIKGLLVDSGWTPPGGSAADLAARLRIAEEGRLEDGASLRAMIDDLTARLSMMEADRDAERSRVRESSIRVLRLEGVVAERDHILAKLRIVLDDESDEE